MARITVEDCLEHVDNRFNLVLLAAKRARSLAMQGAEPLVPPGEDKMTVVALREIAAGKINAQTLGRRPVVAKATVNDEADDKV